MIKSWGNKKINSNKKKKKKKKKKSNTKLPKDTTNIQLSL